MPKTRKSHPPSLKAKVAVEAIKAHKTAAQIAQMFRGPPDAGRRLEETGAGWSARYFRQRPANRCASRADTEKDELYKQTSAS